MIIQLTKHKLVPRVWLFKHLL